MIDWSQISTWRVLLVDDEIDNLEVVAESLEFLGTQVCATKNGQEALAKIEDFKPNLIIADLSMPVMDGWQLRTNIKDKADYRDIPILALSAHAMAGDKERVLAAGFDGYLTKPVNIHSLLDDIRAAAQEQTKSK